MIQISRRVAFYETDMMGVVHHSNYLRFFEDARLAWLAKSGLLEEYSQKDGLQFAVVDAQVSFKKPATYGEEIQIHMQVRKNKAKLVFDYEIYNSHQERICTGSTSHATVDANLKVTKIPQNIINLLEKQNG